MPVEIKELVVKALVALDCENKTVTPASDNIVCPTLPDNKEIEVYVSAFFNQQKAKTISFDQSKLIAFLVAWQASLLK